MNMDLDWSPTTLTEEVVGVTLAQALGDRACLVDLVAAETALSKERVRQAVQVAGLLAEACKLHGLPTSMMGAVSRELTDIHQFAGILTENGFGLERPSEVQNALRNLAERLRGLRDWLLDSCDADDVERIEVNPYTTQLKVVVPSRVEWFEDRVRLVCEHCSSIEEWTLWCIPTPGGLDTQAVCESCQEKQSWHPMVHPAAVIATWRWTQAGCVPEQPFGLRQAQPHRRVESEDGQITWLSWPHQPETYWQTEWPNEFEALLRWKAIDRG